MICYVDFYYSTLLCVSFILQFQNQTVVTEEENIEKEDLDTNIIDSENEQMIKEPDDGNNEALGQTRFFKILVCFICFHIL